MDNSKLMAVLKNLLRMSKVESQLKKGKLFVSQADGATLEKILTKIGFTTKFHKIPSRKCIEDFYTEYEKDGSILKVFIEEGHIELYLEK